MQSISSNLVAIREVVYLHFQNKQSARTPKKPERLSCQVSLEKLTLKQISVNEKAVWKR